MKSFSISEARDGVALENARHPSFHGVFLFWLKLGFISFGGPTGQIAVMHAELVKKEMDQRGAIPNLGGVMLVMLIFFPRTTKRYARKESLAAGQCWWPSGWIGKAGAKFWG